MRECEWKRMSEDLHANTVMGRILEKDNEQSLLEAIKTGEVFGFAVADVTTPPEVIADMGNFLFPPVIQRLGNVIKIYSL